MTCAKSKAPTTVMMFEQVDLTEYVEKHNFVFDAVLNEEVSNDEVRS